MSENGTPVRIRHFTDPSCPFAFSAERQRLRLRWLYGDQLSWSTHMVVLSERPSSDYTPERLAAGRRMLHERYGMPIAWTPPPQPSASVEACRAVVAARLQSEERCGMLLRRLRVLCFSGLPLDDLATIARAAAEAGIEPGELDRWIAAPEVEEALRADMAAARSPSPASRAQDDRLGGPRRSGATRARAMSWNAPRRPRRTGPRRDGSTSPASAPSRPTRRRSPTSRPS